MNIKTPPYPRERNVMAKENEERTIEEILAPFAAYKKQTHDGMNYARMDSLVQLIDQADAAKKEFGKKIDSLTKEMKSEILALRRKQDKILRGAGVIPKKKKA